MHSNYCYKLVIVCVFQTLPRNFGAASQRDVDNVGDDVYTSRSHFPGVTESIHNLVHLTINAIVQYHACAMPMPYEPGCMQLTTISDLKAQYPRALTLPPLLSRPAPSPCLSLITTKPLHLLRCSSRSSAASRMRGHSPSGTQNNCETTVKCAARDHRVRSLGTINITREQVAHCQYHEYKDSIPAVSRGGWLWVCAGYARGYVWAGCV